jgi:hypothetical protein
MTKQKSPHTQTEQNTKPEQDDLEAGEQEYEADSPADQRLYERMEGAETGGPRSPKKIKKDGPKHKTEPEAVAHEGSVSTRAPKRPVQGVSFRSAMEESRRQRKVVKARPDAQAGLNHSK